MPGLERLLAVRVVAMPEAIDRALWPRNAVPIRVAPDEVLVLHARNVVVDDPHAIVEWERGFAGAVCTAFDRHVVQAHTEWPIPTDRGVLAQGKVAGVPAKVWTFTRLAGAIQLDGDDFLLLVQRAYADELRERLGW